METQEYKTVTLEIRHFARENLEIVTQHWDELKRAYKRVFEGPPWYEEWPLDKVEQVLRETIVEKNTCKGSMLFLGGKLAGFVWFYGFIENNKPVTSPTVDFETVVSNIEQLGYEPESSLYFAELGILPEEQFKGYGGRLLEASLENIRSNGREHVFYRTINPVVKHLCDKLESKGAIKKHEKDVFRDPLYPERLWQLMIL